MFGTHLHKFWNIESKGEECDRNHVNQDSFDVWHGLKKGKWDKWDIIKVHCHYKRLQPFQRTSIRDRSWSRSKDQSFSWDWAFNKSIHNRMKYKLRWSVKWESDKPEIEDQSFDWKSLIFKHKFKVQKRSNEVTLSGITLKQKTSPNILITFLDK